MNPRDARRGRLIDFALPFDLPVGSSNRGVANLVAEGGGAVWGMVYQIRRSEARRLDRSEGVHRGFYRRMKTTIDLEGREQVEAFTYISANGRDGRLPSARYLGLIVNSAIYHQLPTPWVEQLRAWPLAKDEREQQQGDLF